MQALFKLSKNFFFIKKKIIIIIMLARSPERIFRIGNIRLLEETNASFCRKLQVASFYSSLKQPYTKFIIMLSHFSGRILKI